MSDGDLLLDSKARKSANNKSFYARNKRLEYRAEWRRKNPDKVRQHLLKRNYGLGPGEYERILQAQGGGCAICGTTKSETIREKFMAVDHDHDSGEIRGILCSRCNKGIGHMHDSPLLLARAIAYLAVAHCRDPLAIARAKAAAVSDPVVEAGEVVKP